MLVALSEADADACTRVLKPLTAGRSVAIMRVAHIKAACERMLVTRPILVIYAEALGGEERRLVVERAQDISAITFVLRPTTDDATLQAKLGEALKQADQPV